tara:strand:+ start:1089 stop:1649 length:561 start_codon:yes stop_codon:yes gene_type:complete
MDNELLYGDPEGDPITKPDAPKRTNVSEEAALGEIYSNATSLTSEPIIPGGDVNFESTLPPVADINGAAAGSSTSGISPVVNNIFIFLMSGSTLNISRATVLSSYNDESNWSISIPISSLAYNSGGTIAFDTNTALNVGTGASGGSAQTIARIPIIRGGALVNAFGSYKEGVSSKNGAAVVEYYKI